MRKNALNRHCEEPTGPAFGGPDDKLRDEAIHASACCAMNCFAEPVIARAFARPVGLQLNMHSNDGVVRRGDLPDGQISKNLSIPGCKNKSLRV